MDSQSSSSRWWILTGAGVAGIAGLGYLGYSYWRQGAQRADGAKGGKDVFNSTVPDEQAAARLRIARSIQMHNLAGGIPKKAQPSVRQTPKQGPAKANSAGNRKICSRCSQPTPPGLPLRCSGCKQVYYCTQECQKKAWPEHKNSCKSMAAAKQGKEQEAPESLPTLATAAAAGKEEPKTFQDALAMYLEQNAASKADKMEATFEMAVMQFVKGDFPTSISQLRSVQAMAKERGQTSVEGDVFKWLGHAHNKMGETKRAEELFSEGIEFASKTNNPRLEIECLGGLGVMLKAQDQTGRAVELMLRALELSEKLQDADLKASTLCNLGSTLVQSPEAADRDKAMVHLREAVKIREQMVEKLHAMGERSGLATAVMEHAHAMINLANALYIHKEFEQAKAAYEQALEVFELVEDADKVTKVLINLSNLCEMQIKTVVSRRQAAEFRRKLTDFMTGRGMKVPEAKCPVCTAPQTFKEPTTDDSKELIVLSCAHCLHNKCWEKWVEDKAKSGKTITCPTCSEIVPVMVVN